MNNSTWPKSSAKGFKTSEIVYKNWCNDLSFHCKRCKKPWLIIYVQRCLQNVDATQKQLIKIRFSWMCLSIETHVSLARWLTFPWIFCLECDTYYEPVGCFKDNQNIPRPLPEYAMNERDYSISNWNGKLIDWRNWNTYSPQMICRCAAKAKALGRTTFGIQFYGKGIWKFLRISLDWKTYQSWKPSVFGRLNAFERSGLQQRMGIFKLVIFTINFTG